MKTFIFGVVLSALALSMSFKAASAQISQSIIVKLPNTQWCNVYKTEIAPTVTSPQAKPSHEKNLRELFIEGKNGKYCEYVNSQSGKSKIFDEGHYGNKLNPSQGYYSIEHWAAWTNRCVYDYCRSNGISNAEASISAPKASPIPPTIIEDDDLGIFETAEEVEAERLASAPSKPGNASPKRPNSYSYIINNDCYKYERIYVAIIFYSEEHSTWITKGWYNLKYGEKKKVIETINRYIYIYGVSKKNGKIQSEWSGDMKRYVVDSRFQFIDDITSIPKEAEMKGFGRVDMGDRFREYTTNLTCPD